MQSEGKNKDISELFKQIDEFLISGFESYMNGVILYLLYPYVWYGGLDLEPWNNKIWNKLEGFEFWINRRMMRISRTKQATNE